MSNVKIICVIAPERTLHQQNKTKSPQKTKLVRDSSPGLLNIESCLDKGNRGMGKENK